MSTGAKERIGTVDKRIYEGPDQLRGCDKGGHKERSIFNSPVHRRHWKKVVKKEKYDC